MIPGPRNLITDVAGVVVGHAKDDKIRTGTTVLAASAPFVSAVHVMGGAPGTRETELLAPDKLVPAVDALVLSGGSAFGLDAASGVVDTLRDAGRGFPTPGGPVPIVPAAILFDLANGGRKDWHRNPYADLGRRALQTAGKEFAQGSVGAGAGASAYDLKGGLGSASAVLDNGLTVGALIAVNSHGAVVGDAQGRFWAAPFERDQEFGGLGAPQAPAPASDPTPKPRPDALGATVIGIVATDARLDKAQAQRLAVSAHDGIARAILPSHTPFDGDLLFSAATGQIDLPEDPLATFQLGHAAACCVSRAIARAIYCATPSPGDLWPTWSERFGPQD